MLQMLQSDQFTKAIAAPAVAVSHAVWQQQQLASQLPVHAHSRNIKMAVGDAQCRQMLFTIGPLTSCAVFDVQLHLVSGTWNLVFGIWYLVPASCWRL